MVASKKTRVIEWIFNHKERDPATGAIRQPVVTFDEIVDGITAAGADLRRGNPANFWKDLTRHKTLRLNWPPSVLAAGYYGADAIGEGDQASFKFVPVDDGYDPDADAIVFDPEAVRTFDVQSLSMPQAMKALGRRDENWLAQVASRLSVIETHFAVVSDRNVTEVSFLQTGVKLKSGEIDVAYALRQGDHTTWLVSVEAKGRNEGLHGPQIQRAAAEMHRSYVERVGAEGVIPFAIKIVGTSLIHTVEFAPIGNVDDPLVITSQGAIRLVPSVPGIQ